MFGRSQGFVMEGLLRFRVLVRRSVFCLSARWAEGREVNARP